jgi:hypothetical protein
MDEVERPARVDLGLDQDRRARSDRFPPSCTLADGQPFFAVANERRGTRNYSCGVVVEYVTAIEIPDGRVHKTIKGTALPGPEQKIRFMNELTMDEVW